MVKPALHRLLPIAFLLTVTACGGGSGGSNESGASNPPPPPPPPPAAAEPSFVQLSSDTGDFIGRGGEYSYSNADARITVTASGARLTIQIEGDESWLGEFQLPDSYTELQPGSYADLGLYPLHDPAKGGMSWHGEGRACSSLSGWLIIDGVTYDGTTLTAIDLQFEQHCGGNAAALHGEIHWFADDATSPPGPVVPVPAGLWEPADGSTPETGNYVYLESEVGDYIGGGAEYLYTEADAVITVNGANGRLSVAIEGDEFWTGDFRVMEALGWLEVGYYGDLQRYPFHNPVKGGLDWSGEGRGCNELTGWFAIDDLTYEGNTLTAIDLRFEQHCENGGPALHGKIHWDVNDSAVTPGPVVPPPAGLWEPVAGVTPAEGSYVYLESEAGDFIGGGAAYLYTLADGVITVTATGALLQVSIDGDERWTGAFQGMNTLSRLEVGYYGNLQRYPFHNPLRGGLSWSGEGRGCNTLSGWFVVDSVTYVGTTLTAVDLRFEQHCGGAGPALHGAIHWDASDTTSPPGPVVPPPAGLWEPAPGVTPETGNYVYLHSQPGDWVGAGWEYLYTEADALFTANALERGWAISINGDELWHGSFQAMNVLNRLEAGYYGDVQRYPFHNPTKGGLSWSGEGRGCNTLTGWFVVDSVTYDGPTVTAIDLRFEQHCEGGTPALHGKIHWDVNDSTTPPGPVVPPPEGLWEPPPGITPASGNYIYLESQVGDFIGLGGSYLYTLADSQITVNATQAMLAVDINGDESWHANFQGMSTLSRLEVGYYGDLQRYPFHNPVKGGLSWSGEGRGCNTLTGWFVVDSVTYEGNALAAIDLRFEQHCEGGAPALHGAIHWDASDTTTPPGPVVPPPAGLWTPAADISLPTGDYVYLESQVGDWVGNGGSYLYTPLDSQFSVESIGPRFDITIDGSAHWTGTFQGMNTLTRLQPGYYGDLQRFPFHNPAKGGLSWSGQGRGCNTLTGWFVVDSVTYVGVTLEAIELRFEQHCEGLAPALHGQIRWSR